MPEQIILVDEKDNQIGQIEKFKAHQEGRLHRAFSIFIFDKDNKLLLQKRSKIKYHSPGLWSNTCCSHPNPGETVLQAAHRRLPQEMGFDCELNVLFHFIYKTQFKKIDLFEHELDHVIIGHFNGKIFPDPDEVETYKWIDIHDLLDKIEKNPDNYTYWLKAAIYRVNNFI